ncbi:MAG: SLBB domain-containing protein [Bacteroidales bacterium]|nr:SLBB domain-containing protein [Bacteroidales bacterium]
MSAIRRCIAALCAGVLFVSMSWAQSTMTDTQVLEYVKQAVAQGKTQKEMVAELSLRGVTRAQAERVYKLYQEREGSTESKSSALDKGRKHSVNADTNPEYNPYSQDQTRNQNQTWNQNQTLDPSQTRDQGQQQEKNRDQREDDERLQNEMKVYGRDIFRSRNMTFAPSENMATPRNYRLGPGDEIIIDVFGRNQTTLRDVISPEGSINVDVLGPLYLNGKTVEEANAYLKKRLSQIYGGLSGHSGTDMRLSLGQIRSIQINVMGDVASPGTYVLSGFATAFHAIYRAGGVVDPGTLRNIKVVRGNKTVGTVDVYEYMMKGTQSSDIRLEEGDVILVSAYDEMVQVQGNVKRPMFFELKDGETVADLLSYAGGFALGANEESVTVFRQQGKSHEVRTVSDQEFGTFRLRNGDRIEVGIQQYRFENRTAINGAVYMPGTYELGDVRTAKGLVLKAGGLLPEAFTDRVVVHREHADKTQEVFSLNLTEIMAGTKPDFVLQNNDELFIASSDDLKDRGTMTISGMVNNPGTFPFAENTTIEDFIILAGGLQDGASTSRVDVTRRKKDANGMVATSDIGEMYSFSLKEGLVADGDRSFVLKPYDEVIVHQSPSYNIQRHFTVAGEVNFPGEYTLTSREERVSDLIKKAGGLTSFAYVKGARLVREATEEEITQAREMGQLLAKQIDSTAAVNKGKNTLKTGTRHYNIALDLEAALAAPGGPSDVILRENDRLEIPVQSNVVRVFGAVMYPTAVNWNARMTVADYIDAAGGYSQSARRNKTYMVSVGGRAKKVHAGTRVEPGAEIFVPDKEKKNEKPDYTGVVAITSAAASLGTLSVAVVSMVNNLKKSSN